MLRNPAHVLGFYREAAVIDNSQRHERYKGFEIYWSSRLLTDEVEIVIAKIAHPGDIRLEKIDMRFDSLQMLFEASVQRQNIGGNSGVVFGKVRHIPFWLQAHHAGIVGNWLGSFDHPGRELFDEPLVPGLRQIRVD